jgi:ABC-type Zn uptake system ZnuABC Zn-binding protein ZnuA
LAVTGCGPAANRQASGDALRVTATFSVLGDLVRIVGGEHIALTILAGPGTDSHTYSPTPSDAAALAQSQVIFENGLEFETWLDELYIASGSQAVRTVVSEGIELRAAEAEGQGDDDHVEGEPHDLHSAYDPHVWHSAANALVMVRNISAALAAADPAHAADYQANADTYTAQLQELDDWIFLEVQAVPVERRVMVTTHDTFGYLADRYGFTIVGTVLPTSTEGASPSAQELAALVEAIRAQGVTAVFAENMASSNLLSQVAREAGVEVVASLFTDALGPEGSAGATYLEMMRFNVVTIVQALAG